MARTIALVPDTYSIGPCGCIAGADPWLSSFSTVSVQLFQE